MAKQSYGTGYLKTISEKEQVKPKFNLGNISTTNSKTNIYSNILAKVNEPVKTNFKPPTQQTTGAGTTMPTQINKSLLNQITSQKQVFTPTKPATIGTQAKASDKNLIQRYLDDENEDYDNRKAIMEMIQNGEDESFIEDSIVNKIGYTGTTKPQEQKGTGLMDFVEANRPTKVLPFLSNPVTRGAENVVAGIFGGAVKTAEGLTGLTPGKYTWEKDEKLKNTLKISSGLSSSVFNMAMPTAMTAFNTALETPGVKVVPETISKVIDSAAETALQQAPGYADMTEENRNNLKETLVNAIFLKSSLSKKGIAKKVETGLKETKPVESIKNIKEGVKNIKPLNIAEKVSTKANRFNALDEQKFIDTTGETPGQFAVSRGMNEVGTKAVDKAVENYQTSMKQADNAFEDIKGNFKYDGTGNDPINLSLIDLEKRFKNTENDNLPRIKELQNKYETEGLTMPEINELKREYSKNFKYGFEDRNGEALARSSNIQNKLREWQFKKADDMGLSNIKDINKNTQAWKMYADSLEKKLNRSGANNAVSITDWIALSGGNVSNLALFLGKKIGTSDFAKQKLIKTLGKQTKSPIIEPTINKPKIKGLLPKGPIITPTTDKNLGSKFKVTTGNEPRIIKEQKLLGPGKKQPIITPQTKEQGIILESKKDLKLNKTKNDTNNNISNNLSNNRVETKLTPKKPNPINKKGFIELNPKLPKVLDSEKPFYDKVIKQAKGLKPKSDEVIVYQTGNSHYVDTNINKQIPRGMNETSKAFIVKKSQLKKVSEDHTKQGIYQIELPKPLKPKVSEELNLIIEESNKYKSVDEIYNDIIKNNKVPYNIPENWESKFDKFSYDLDKYKKEGEVIPYSKVIQKTAIPDLLKKENIKLVYTNNAKLRGIYENGKIFINEGYDWKNGIDNFFEKKHGITLNEYFNLRRYKNIETRSVKLREKQESIKSNLGNLLNEIQTRSDKAKNSGLSYEKLQRELDYYENKGYYGKNYDNIKFKLNSLKLNYGRKEKLIGEAINMAKKENIKVILGNDKKLLNGEIINMPVIYFELPNGQASFHLPNINTIKYSKKYDIEYNPNYKWSGLKNTPEVIDKYNRQIYEQANKPTILKPKVSEELKPLIEEAKKYKSADEFVNKQTKLYHGGAGIDELKKNFKIITPEEKLKYTSSGGGNIGLSTTSNKEYAKQYSQNIGNRSDVLEIYINPKAKIYDLGNIHIDDLSQDKLAELSKKYDIIKSNQENEFRILTNNGVKTEAQLKQIYEQAHK